MSPSLVHNHPSQTLEASPEDVEYPSAGNRSDGLFYAVKRRAAKRPNMILAHRMLEHGEGYAVGSEVQFYVGHSYNSMLSLVGLTSFEGGTIVFGAVRLFTDQVKGAGAFLKRKAGRRKVARHMARHFKELRDMVEKESEH